MPKFKAVIFDMDGVIVDSEIVYLRWCYDFIKTKNPSVRLEDLYGTVGTVHSDLWLCMANAAGTGQPWEELREEYFAYSSSRKLAVNYQEVFRPEAVGLLEDIRRMNLKMALASSSPLSNIEEALSVNKIRDYFSVVVSGEQFRQSKPDPEIYQFTAKRLGIREEECLAVEDSTVGIAAGKAAGMRVAALVDERFGFDQSQADYLVRRLSEVSEIIK